MAGRMQLLDTPGGVLAAVARRTRYVIIGALAAVGPPLAALLFASSLRAACFGRQRFHGAPRRGA
eukprot:7936350-Alexandrium_andersonii.AAC.1